MRTIRILTVTMYLLLSFGTVARADTVNYMAPVTVQTPTGLKAPESPSGVPNQNVPVPTVVTYVDDSHESVILGTADGLAVGGSLNAPVGQYTGGNPVPWNCTIDGVDGEYLVAAQAVGGTVDPNGEVVVARAFLANGAQDLTGVVLQPVNDGGTVLTNDQVTVLGIPGNGSLDLFMVTCDNHTGAFPVGTMFENYITQEVTHLEAAVYAPVASVVGDPYFKFHSAFKADTHLVIQNRSGKTVRRTDLGLLNAGGHRIKFLCKRLNGKYAVHVHGVAKDGAHQNSPTRKVRC